MEAQEIKNRLAELLAAEMELQTGEKATGDSWVTIPVDKWHQACSLLRRQAEFSFEFLRSLAGVDRPAENAIELVAHLFSYQHRHGFVIKTRLARENPRAATLSDIWPAADWYEREIFDLLGVDFTGHPDLRRIMLPEDWTGHPLRKDYRQEDSYRGIPTRRPGQGPKEAAS